MTDIRSKCILLLISAIFFISYVTSSHIQPELKAKLKIENFLRKFWQRFIQPSTREKNELQ